jgi:hypothetical protein
MLDEVTRGWREYGATGEFRAGQLNVKLDPNVIRELFNELLRRAAELEDDAEKPITLTVIVHPKAPAPAPDA